MPTVQTLNEMKSLIQSGFDENLESMHQYGEAHSKQLKGYLIESNKQVRNTLCPKGYGTWKKLDSDNWYVNHGDNSPDVFFLDASRERVWILYSLLDASNSDSAVYKMINDTQGLDRCWLSRNLLMYYLKLESWRERGIGIKFSDGLSPEESAGNFSLKAWFGAGKKLEGLNEMMSIAKDKFAIHSTRWQKINNGSVDISAEWYSNGKVTINRAVDIDEVLLSISIIANKYVDGINQATDLRNKKMTAFELNFSQNIDLTAFSNTVSTGKGIMNLWLAETESHSDFKRFRGVDLHTWDRVFMDVGLDYAYLTIPGKGCVNAAPRIATLQGEDNAGKTSIYFDGVEMFATL